MLLSDVYIMSVLWSQQSCMCVILSTETEGGPDGDGDDNECSAMDHHYDAYIVYTYFPRKQGGVVTEDSGGRELHA